MSILSELVAQNRWLLLVAIPVGFIVGWYRVRHGSLRLSKQRAQRLYDLAKNGKWRQANPLALQIAAADLFRHQFDDRWIAFALQRHNPWKFLADAKLAYGMVRLTNDGDGIVDNKPERRISLRVWSLALYFILGCMPWVATWIIAAFRLPVGPQVLVGLLVADLVLTPFAIWLSFCCEAARRLSSELDERHPRLPDKQAHNGANVSELTSKSAGRARKRNGAESDKAALISSDRVGVA